MKRLAILISLVLLIAGCTNNTQLDEQDSIPDETEEIVQTGDAEQDQWSELEGMTDFNLITRAYESVADDLTLALQACLRVQDLVYKETCYKNLPKAIFTGASYAALLQLSQAGAAQIEVLFDYCVNNLPQDVDFSNFNGNTGVAGCLDVIVNVQAEAPIYANALGAERVIDEFCNAQGMSQSEACISAVNG